MSRTDKTDPYWVKAQRYGVVRHNHVSGVCEVSTERRWWHPTCWLEVPDTVEKPFWQESPPRWYVHMTWWGPERARESRLLREEIKAYRGGEDDLSFDSRQHRSEAKYDWW